MLTIKRIRRYDTSVIDRYRPYFGFIVWGYSSWMRENLSSVINRIVKKSISEAFLSVDDFIVLFLLLNLSLTGAINWCREISICVDLSIL